MKEKFNISSLLWISVYFVLLAGIFLSALIYLTGEWKKDDFSYCYIVPFIIFYLIWEKKEQFFSAPSLPSWKGIFILCLGIFFFWVGELGGEYTALYISFWLVLVGLCWLHMGWEKIKIISFPLAFILTMFPPPNFIYNKISVSLKLLSSQLGVATMQIFGMSAYREGNVIDLGFTQLQVVDACSGLRYLFPLIILGLLLAYFYKDFFWKKILLVISTIPISIFVNGIRIASVGILYPVFGQKVAVGFFHDFSGWFIFMISVGIMVVEMWVLRKIPPRISLSYNEPPAGTDSKEPGVAPIQNSTFKIQNLFPSPQFAVAVLLLGATWGLSHGIEFREKIPVAKSFDQFPLRVGKWTGIRKSMEPKFIDALDLSDYVMIDYQDPQGRNLNFYVAYYESQRKGESIHSPATCLPGGGWIFKNAGAVKLPFPLNARGDSFTNRALMEKTGIKQLVYYWFPQRGRILTNAYQLKIFAFWDALTKQRTDGALVRVITLIYQDEDIKAAENRAQKFILEIAPVLDEYLPR